MNYRIRIIFVFIAHYFLALFQSLKHIVKSLTQPTNVIIILLIYALYDIIFVRSGYWFFLFLGVVVIHMLKSYFSGEHIAWDRKRLYTKIMKKDGEDVQTKPKE